MTYVHLTREPEQQAWGDTGANRPNCAAGSQERAPGSSLQESSLGAQGSREPRCRVSPRGPGA